PINPTTLPGQHARLKADTPYKKQKARRLFKYKTPDIAHLMFRRLNNYNPTSNQSNNAVHTPMFT
ncbi:hypothetical protein ACTXNJ_28225, partial [Pseudomonas helleri]|uniref:hypothetical protein n=1 Tax=Pseudomonas helleri TaxID=1608996 RepID=UPI003FCF79FC